MADALNPPATANGGFIDTGLAWLEKGVDIYGDLQSARRTDIEYQAYDATEAERAPRASGSTGLVIAAGLALAAFVIYRAMR